MKAIGAINIKRNNYRTLEHAYQASKTDDKKKSAQELGLAFGQKG